MTKYQILTHVKAKKTGIYLVDLLNIGLKEEHPSEAVETKLRINSMLKSGLLAGSLSSNSKLRITSKGLEYWDDMTDEMQRQAQEEARFQNELNVQKDMQAQEKQQHRSSVWANIFCVLLGAVLTGLIEIILSFFS